jgi:hypothetical protein
MASCADIDRPLVDEAQRLIATIPDSPRFTWNFRYKRLCEKIISEGCLDNMLSWPTVSEALFAGQTGRVRKELFSLPSSVIDKAYDAPYPPMPPSSPHVPSGTYTRQAHIAYLLAKESLWWPDVQTVYEVGGGYGAMAIILRRFGFRGAHYVLDHPVMDLIRHRVLLGVTGAGTVSARQHRPVPCDVLIGVHSLCEIDVETRESILAEALAKHYAFSITKTYDGVDNVAWFKGWCASQDLDYAYHVLPSDNQLMIIASRK